MGNECTGVGRKSGPRFVENRRNGQIGPCRPSDDGLSLCHTREALVGGRWLTAQLPIGKAKVVRRLAEQARRSKTQRLARRARRIAEAESASGPIPLAWASTMEKPLPTSLLSMTADHGGRRPGHHGHHGWPRMMDAKTAAAYCCEPSADAFRRRARKPGLRNPPDKIYPAPLKVHRARQRWDRVQLDLAIDALSRDPTKTTEVSDAASVL